MAINMCDGLVLKDGFKLHVGFTFNPTDHELVDYYLMRKVYYKPIKFPDILEFTFFRLNH